MIADLDTAPFPSRLAITAFGSIALSAVLTLHLYWGIQHDAVLYTMQGLAHLHPDLYANDAFLKYGSQDRYSAFGQIYAIVIGALGVDHAAAVVTFLSHLALLCGAWRLARCLMPKDAALLAVALLGVLELPYGSGGVFTVIEDFATPRELSEALVLGAMAATLLARNGVAIALLGIAVVIHPIMALAGVAWRAGMRSTRLEQQPWIPVALSTLGVLVVLGSTLLQPPAPAREEWISLAINRAPYLLVSNWSVVAWSNLSRPVATLCVLAMTADDELTRKTSWVVLSVAALGVLTSLIAGDWLHVVLVLQAQPWRWTWMTVALGTLLLPRVITRLWRLGGPGRTALALLMTVYFLQDEIYAPLIALLAVVAAWIAIAHPTWIEARSQKLILVGSLGLLLIGIAWDIANRFVYSKIPFVGFAGLPHVTMLRRIARGTFIPASLVMVCWWTAFRLRALLPIRVMLVMGALAGIATTAICLSRFSIVRYPASIYAAFNPWRSRIPVGTEVLWAGDPLNTWIYLERPSFFSDQQLSTTLYSAVAAKLVRRRFLELEPFLASEGVAMSGGDGASKELTLVDLCSHPGIQFVVSHRRFAAQPLETLPADLPFPYRGLKLFGCEARTG